MWAGWGTSAIVHAVFLVVITLLLVPMGATGTPFEFSLAPAHPKADLTVLEPLVAAAKPTQTGRLSSTELSDHDLPELHIASPLDLLASNSDDHDQPSASLFGGNESDAGAASFFGTVANGQHFVYILDISPSMNHREGRRLERAVLELLRSIDRLAAEQSFYVIVFGWQARRMFDDVAPVPEMIPATLKHKRALRNWLAGLTTIFGTDPTQAIKLGLGIEPSAIFLLSDGEFNRPGRRRGSGGVARGVIGAIRRKKSGRIPVHTITYEDRAGERVMDRIAAESGGLSRFVPAPVEKSPLSKRKRLRYKVWPSFRRSVLGYAFGKEEDAGRTVSGG